MSGIEQNRRQGTTASIDRRRTATEQHQQAIESINEMFDRMDDLAKARNLLTGIQPLGPGDDPIRDVMSLVEHAERLNEALVELRAAALGAAEHRRRSDLATDLGTKLAVLFPRTPRRPPVGTQATSSPADASSTVAALDQGMS